MDEVYRDAVPGSVWQMAFEGGDAQRQGQEDDRLRLSDVGKLARRTRRRIVGAARAGDRPTLTGMLAEHLGGALHDLDVVEESWPAYDHVNVQVGLDAWLADPGRTHQLVEMTGYRGRQFGLGDLLRTSPEPFGPAPGNVSWVSLASGPDGEVRRAVSAGIHLVADGDTRAAVLLMAAEPESGMGATRLHVVADTPGAAAGIASEVRRLSVQHNDFRGQ
jgi:hypothetical protein